MLRNAVYDGGGDNEAVGRVDRVRLVRKFGGLEVWEDGWRRAASGRHGKSTEVGERTSMRMGSSWRASERAETADGDGGFECVGVVAFEEDALLEREALCSPESHRKTGSTGCELSLLWDWGRDCELVDGPLMLAALDVCTGLFEYGNGIDFLFV